ncbi:hypothetical protein B9Z55_025343 [Caenorhabditis nigoni]|uniref:Uncharacterized protein n=1 Tax=Caenorhabditis nigoni TaxID=1611254 RepID=A0A2G5SY90_9PELO|nr:hypothetical protein B9Z55_025343 [Caenorhabditis nigoni]
MPPKAAKKDDSPQKPSAEQLKVDRSFAAMKLDKCTGKEDFEDRPFVLTAREQIEPEFPLYGCAFDPYVRPESRQVVAVCGGNRAHVFHVPHGENKLNHIWSVSFEQQEDPTKKDRKEELLTVTWAYDTYDHDQRRPCHRVVVAGVLGHIYVVDLKTRMLFNRLRSYGGDVNDLRVCPTDSNLIAGASSDQTIRIHHIRNQAALITIGGPFCHPGPILSVDWSSDGTYLLSCGFDHQVMKWDLTAEPAKSWLQKTCKELEKGVKDIYFQSGLDANREPVKAGSKKCGKDKDNEVLREVLASLHRPHDNTLELYTPVAQISDLHHDYMDCIRILPDTDFFASKSVCLDPHLNISALGVPGNIRTYDRGAPLEPERNSYNAMWFAIGEGERWFHKFSIDPMRRWIAGGGDKGSIMFFDLHDEQHNQDGEYITKPDTNRPKPSSDQPSTSERLPHPSRVRYYNVSDAGIRNVDFSTCGRYVVAVTDDSFVIRMDRVKKDVSVDKLTGYLEAMGITK